MTYYHRDRGTSTPSHQSPRASTESVTHLRKHVHSVTREGEMWCCEQSKRIELVTKSPLRNGELGGIGPIEAVDAIDPEYTVLEYRLFAM